MTTAERHPNGQAWISRLPPHQPIDLRTTHPMSALRPQDGAQDTPPELLLLDERCLDELEVASLRFIDSRPGHVRVMLVSDDFSDSARQAVFQHRMDGMLLSSAEPDVWMKACEAVCRGELWLPRAWLTLAVRDVFAARAHEPAPDEAPVGMEGDDRLSPRQDEIVRLLRLGLSNKQIARRLDIQEDTVKKHLQNVYARLGVHRRALVVLRLPSDPGA